MKKAALFIAFVAVLFCLGGYYGASRAEEPRRIFTHISTDANHRLQKALGYTANQMDRGVLVAVWADDTAVLALSKKNAEAFAKEQAQVARLIEGKALVVACPFSMKHYGVSAEDLVPGVVVGGSFDLLDSFLFAPGVRTLNW